MYTKHLASQSFFKISIVMIRVVCHGVDLSAGCPHLLLSGSRLPTVLLQALPKWLGPVGEAY